MFVLTLHVPFLAFAFSACLSVRVAVGMLRTAQVIVIFEARAVVRILAAAICAASHVVEAPALAVGASCRGTGRKLARNSAAVEPEGRAPSAVVDVKSGHGQIVKGVEVAPPRAASVVAPAPRAARGARRLHLRRRGARYGGRVPASAADA